MALFPFSRARIGNADLPWLPSICSNGTVIGTTGNSSAGMCQKHFTTPPIFFEKPVWNRRTRRGAALGPPSNNAWPSKPRALFYAPPAGCGRLTDRPTDGPTDDHPE